MSAKTVQLMAFDVDGVFTDGTLYFGIEINIIGVNYSPHSLGSYSFSTGHKTT